MMLVKIGINKKVELENGILIDFYCVRYIMVCCFKYYGVDGYIVK